MYLVAIHVPIYVDGDRSCVSTEWKRSLILLRDSLQGRFGRLVVAAPTLSVASEPLSQEIEPIDAKSDEIDLIGSIPLSCRARHYWLTYRRRWLNDLRPLIGEAAVVHAGLDQLYKPIMYDAWRLAHRMRRPNIFVQDTDIALQIIELSAAQPWHRRFRARAYAAAYASRCRHGVRCATLSLLKGTRLMQRYGQVAKNAHMIQDTSYTSDEIVDASVIDQRLAGLSSDRPIRMVYFGRFVERKGLSWGLKVLREAQALGARMTFDLIGDGEQKAQLQQQIADNGLADTVRLLPRMSYGSQLLNTVSKYDALYFTPLGEDTPRMIFDAYAAGLPMVAADIPYCRERHQQEHATWLLDRRDVKRSAERLVELDRNRDQLAQLTRAAHEAAFENAADNWYKKRAEWTFEAVAKFGNP